ncbi:MAG: hypothetical protein JSW23_00890 [Planctomycetota bacterium]|nr:MAG: hypothetical protein JSW23_00890 [Planctomycetota bacterium]
MAEDSSQFVKTLATKKTTRWLIRGLVLAVILWPVGVMTGRMLLHVTVAQIIKLTNSKVAFESIDYSFDGSISLEKLVISPYIRLSDDDAILKAEKVYARFGVGSLLMLRPSLKQLSIKGFVFNAQHDIDTDSWNFGALKIKPSRGGSGKIPRILLEDGILQYSEVSNGQIKRTAALPINASLGFDKETPEGYRFVVTAAKAPEPGKSPLTGFVRPGQIVLKGAVPRINLPDFGRTWEVTSLHAELDYDRRWNYILKLKVIDLRGSFTRATDDAASEDSSALQRSGPFAALTRFFHRYRPAGLVDIKLQASGSLSKISGTTLSGRVYCKDISICHRSFPYQVERLTGEVDFTEQSAVLNNLRGYHDDVELFFDGFTREFGPNRKYDVRITSDNMALDQDLYEALKPRQKKFWSLFSPTGLAAIDYRLSRYPPADKERSLAVQLLGAEAAYSNFPYPLRNLSGTLLFDYDTVTASDLVSETDGSKITINGKATSCRTDRPISDFRVKAENVPLDSTLASALPPAQKPLYDRLCMAGSADADIKVFTPQQDLSPTTFNADVFFKEASLKASFLELAQPAETSSDSPTKKQSPLTFSDVSARTVFTPDLIRIEEFAGRCEFGAASVTGRILPGEQPQYDLVLHTDEVQISDELIDMLPASLSKVASELNPEGKVNLGIAVGKGPTGDKADYKMTVDFLGNSVNSRKFPYPLKDITGSLSVTGNTVIFDDIVATPADGNHVIAGAPVIKIDGQVMFADETSEAGQCKVSNGDVAFVAESLRIKGAALANLTAGICYDPNRQNWLARNLLADCYGGRLAGKLELRQSTDDAYEYLLQTGFENVDLKEFLADITQKQDAQADNHKHTTGRMSGSLNVAGRTRESLPRIGRCSLKITNMQVGKLSPLAKLLYVLNLTGPKDFAFERMLVDAYINNNKVFIESFDLSGEAIAFSGSGSLDMQNWMVDLTLTARGRRLATAEPSVLQSLPDALGGAVVRMEVTGNIYDPQVETRALPVIADSLNILGAKPTEEK